MAEAEDAGGAAAAGEEVKPYRIHVPPKYLELTKQKLELTRLPHEGSEPKSQDWWEPKPQVEPLIDIWLEKYSWRDQEKSLNDSLPQFRTSITLASQEAPLRLHFVHVRSRHANALPVLLLPPFPFTNLSFGHLAKPFTDPEDAAASQPFHLVMPALPGLGFSDPLPNNTPVIATVADMLNTLMASRLGYEHYLVTNAGAASSSPAEIDWKLANHLVTHHPESCLGAHLISPPLASPRLVEAPLEWAKWSVANFFHAGILGYSPDDFSALERAHASALASLSSWWGPSGGGGGSPAISNRRRNRLLVSSPAQFGLNKFGLREPNTLAYALCDSPTGLLVFVIKALSLLGPKVHFTPEQILTFAQLAWLPGPEYAMRFWASCAAHGQEEVYAEAARKRASQKDAKTGSVPAKPRVAITVFLGGSETEAGTSSSGDDAAAAAAPAAATATAAEQQQNGGGSGRGSGGSGGGAAAVVVEPGRQVDLPSPMPHEEAERYSCPAWGRTHYDVVHAQRLPGRPGLLAWERPEAILTGLRGLAREILRLDKRLKPEGGEPGTEPLRQVVVGGGNSDGRNGGGGEGSAQTPPGSRGQQGQGQGAPSQEQQQAGRPGGILSKIPEEPSAVGEAEGSMPLLQIPEAAVTKVPDGPSPGPATPQLQQLPESPGIDGRMQTLRPGSTSGSGSGSRPGSRPGSASTPQHGLSDADMIARLQGSTPRLLSDSDVSDLKGKEKKGTTSSEDVLLLKEPKGKELDLPSPSSGDLLAPPPVVGGEGGGFSDGESPDTLVVTTPPLDGRS